MDIGKPLTEKPWEVEYVPEETPADAPKEPVPAPEREKVDA